uniref:Uncharacterized protein n=1 Tax=Arion vulgaris TaxID=1028688 RepID=A0A0B7BNC0_9EUPU
MMMYKWMGLCITVTKQTRVFQEICGRVIAKQNGSYRTSTSSMNVEVEVITAVLQCLSETLLLEPVIISVYALEDIKQQVVV